MNDLIRKSIYTGVGAVVLAKERFSDFVEELIQNNELTREQGQRVVQSFISQLEEGKEAIEEDLRTRLDKALLNLNLPSHNEMEAKLSDWLAKLRKELFSAGNLNTTEQSPVSRNNEK